MDDSAQFREEFASGHGVHRTYESSPRCSRMAPVGLEPTHRFARLRILSPLRLPIPPQGP